MVLGLEGLVVSYIVMVIPYNVVWSPVVVVIYDAGQI